MRVRFRGTVYAVIVVRRLGGMHSATDGSVVCIADTGDQENNCARAVAALERFFEGRQIERG